MAHDDVIPLLSVGMDVMTPRGPGVIHDISLMLGDYGHGNIQLEPPDIQVKLDSGKIIHCCICKLGFDDPDLERIIQREFSRLWPPVETAVPDAAIVSRQQSSK